MAFKAQRCESAAQHAGRGVWSQVQGGETPFQFCAVISVILPMYALCERIWYGCKVCAIYMHSRAAHIRLTCRHGQGRYLQLAY